MQENGLNKFRTIFSEVSSFVGNPVYQIIQYYTVQFSNGLKRNGKQVYSVLY